MLKKQTFSIDPKKNPFQFSRPPYKRLKTIIKKKNRHLPIKIFFFFSGWIDDGSRTSFVVRYQPRKWNHEC